ncbi:MAG: phospholipase D family protein [Hyphomicrobiaceae bacterium]
MSEGKPWPAQAYLDALRPEPGWRVGTAILASYSADLPAIGAALLALAGRDDERGSGSRTDFAEAVESLRGRLRILIQRGRLAKLKRLPAIAGILDQFLVEVPFDEADRSWHPKLALLRLIGPKDETAWRFWIGSRNLTSTENLDFGLLIKGASGTRAAGLVVEGLQAAAVRLAELAKLQTARPAVFGQQVGQVRWTAPAGLRIRRVHLTSGEGDEALPEAPDRAEDVVVISPFLDGGFVGAVGGWGKKVGGHTLLSTYAELGKLARQSGRPLAAYDGRILAFEAPVPESVEPVAADTDSVPPSPVEAGAEEVALGLHAKILAVRTGAKLRLWVGSANATRRAWSGENVEIIAELEGAADLRAGLDHVLGRGRPIAEAALAAEPPEEADETRDRLDLAREHIAARWAGRLLCQGDTLSLAGESLPHPPDVEVELEAGLATGPLLPWPRELVQLVLGEYPLSLQTELVQLRLTLHDRQCAWLQRCPIEPPLDETRDRAALARHLGPRAFLDWLRALLQDNGKADDGTEPWDALPGSGGRDNGDDPSPWQDLTLEDMLSCWARDPAAFGRADERLTAFLDQVIAHSETPSAIDLERLRSLRELWVMLRDELVDRR